MKKFVHFCKWFQLCQPEEGQRKPSSYLFESKMEGTVNVFDTLYCRINKENAYCITQTKVTL